MIKNIIGGILGKLQTKEYADGGLPDAFYDRIPSSVDEAAALLGRHCGQDGKTSEKAVIAAIAELHSRLDENGEEAELARLEKELLPRLNWLEAFPCMTLPFDESFAALVPQTFDRALALLDANSGEDGMASNIGVVAALAQFYAGLQKSGDGGNLARFSKEILPRINWSEAVKIFEVSAAPPGHDAGPELPDTLDNPDAPELLSLIDGGHLHLQITSRCNMRCSFCYQKNWDIERQSAPDMPEKWIYDYCRPLYEKVQEINVFGGEITAIPEGFRVVSFLAENYPAVTLHLESNGLAFNEKWQEFAIKNLMYVSFSVNAATPETFARAIWPQGGVRAFEKVHANIDSYVNKLREAGLSAFSPVITMVVSPETAHEIRAFVAMGLKWGCRRIHLLMNQRFSRCVELEPVMGWAMLEMLKMERVLAGGVRLDVKLFLPEAPAASMQAEVDAMPMQKLREEYADLLELARGRDEEREHAERMAARKARGKKPVEKNLEIMTSCGCYYADMPAECVNRCVCAPPWKSLSVSNDGMLVQCPWNYKYKANLQSFLTENGIDWNNVLNGHEFRLMRRNILAGDYSGCMEGCPYLPHVAKALHRDM